MSDEPDDFGVTPTTDGKHVTFRERRGSVVNFMIEPKSPAEPEPEPYSWYDPEWVRVESTVFGVDGTVTRSAGWVRREEWCREWFRNGESPAQPSEED